MQLHPWKRTQLLKSKVPVHHAIGVSDWLSARASLILYPFLMINCLAAGGGEGGTTFLMMIFEGGGGLGATTCRSRQPVQDSSRLYNACPLLIYVLWVSNMLSC